MSVLIVVVALAVIGALLGVRAVRPVPDGHVEIVERLGRYRCTLRPGLHLVVPFLDTVRARVPLAPQRTELPPRALTARDGREIRIGAEVHYRVTDPRAAVYRITSPEQGVEQLVRTMLRHLAGDMDAAEMQRHRAGIGTTLREELAGPASGWGLDIERVEPVLPG
ncbi:SPFH domain-containing protein [Streptomyces sp. YIM 98790]|uniref:SPFH domain-containing protein n=1 Tax=Streptomyces sp. YIM 98790 TaxID=2689077 RepID=UPI0014093109|nr:SPFH domain-containing protein [Streptomyces sp. YIM 98790]